MENQKKKLRLEEIKVESFVTSWGLYSQTVLGGSLLNGGCSGGVTPTPIFDGPGSGGWRRDDGGGGGGFTPGGGGGNVVDTAEWTPLQTVLGVGCPPITEPPLPPPQGGGTTNGVVGACCS